MTINGRPIEAMGASARAARLVVDDLDALKSTKTQFDPYQVRYPPDGYLDRAEFSSRHFESIAQRGDKDGRVSRAELEMALAIAKPGVAERVEQAALAARGDLLAEVDAARGALVPFAVGAFAAAGGLILGGTLGLSLVAFGITAAVAGMAFGFGAAIASARTRQALVATVDATLEPAAG